MNFKISNFFADFLDYCVSTELVRFQRAHSLPPLIWVLCELAIILLSFVWTKVIKFAFCTVVLPNFNSFNRKQRHWKKFGTIHPTSKERSENGKEGTKSQNRQTGFPENDSQTQLQWQLTVINVCFENSECLEMSNLKMRTFYLFPLDTQSVSFSTIINLSNMFNKFSTFVLFLLLGLVSPNFASCHCKLLYLLMQNHHW